MITVLNRSAWAIGVVFLIAALPVAWCGDCWRQHRLSARTLPGIRSVDLRRRAPLQS